jgi:hypothetical protein
VRDIFGVWVMRCLGNFVGFVGVLLGLQGLYGLFLWVVCRVLLGTFWGCS